MDNASFSSVSQSMRRLPSVMVTSCLWYFTSLPHSGLNHFSDYYTAMTHLRPHRATSCGCRRHSCWKLQNELGPSGLHCIRISIWHGPSTDICRATEVTETQPTSSDASPTTILASRSYDCAETCLAASPNRTPELNNATSASNNTQPARYPEQLYNPRWRI